MIRTLLRLERIRGDIRVASADPKPLAKRLFRREAHRLLHKVFRFRV